MKLRSFVWINNMARYNEKALSLEKQNELMDEFCQILSVLQKKEKIFNFLKDLFNRKERLMIIRRLLIARRLEEGKKYYQIQAEFKCGRNTISRVQKLLHFGRGGYRVAISAIKK